MNVFVLNAENKNLNGVKRGLMEALKGLDLTKPKQVVITEYKESKSSRQRAWFHILVGIFGEEVGYTKLQMKRVMLKEVFGTENIMGTEIAKSSESLKRDEYSQLIEQTYIKAAEVGVSLPPPERGML